MLAANNIVGMRTFSQAKYLNLYYVLVGSNDNESYNLIHVMLEKIEKHTLLERQLLLIVGH